MRLNILLSRQGKESYQALSLFLPLVMAEGIILARESRHVHEEYVSTK